MAHSIDAAYPTIARWVMEFGWIEIGHDDMRRSFVRALSVGILWHPYWLTPTQIADGHSPGWPLLCNDLVYKGLLRPKRSPKHDAIFPALGYAHIRGAAEREGSSWGNTLEASTIAQWLYQHHRAIIEHYQKTKPDRQLDDIVAIVTPYRPQALKIMRELAKKFPSAIVNKLTVNTVHSLQGAERDIVIFSPTVRAYNVSLPFHDRDRRMLNVAVSRAKDSFLVFGDMELFRQDQNRLPSSLLAKRLYSSVGNQLQDIFPSFGFLAEIEAEKILSGLSDHQKMLLNVLEQAQDRVLICSPFIRRSAVESDGLLTKIRKCVGRGVQLIVTTDEKFDALRGELAENARTGKESTICSWRDRVGYR